MTLLDLPAVPTAAAAFRPVAFDLYRDIHKGIRAELFAVTGTAGSVGPNDPGGRAALAGHVADVARLLDEHAGHEDQAIGEALVATLPDLAERVDADHVVLEARLAEVADLVRANADGDVADRSSVHHAYLLLASFTSAYLAHQELEDLVVMPALEQAIGVPAVIEIHGRILGAIPPDEMARSLALMVPAMNVDDRTDLLGGMRASAPPEAFQATWGLVTSVLPARDVDELATRLGLG